MEEVDCRLRVGSTASGSVMILGEGSLHWQGLLNLYTVYSALPTRVDVPPWSKIRDAGPYYFANVLNFPQTSSHASPGGCGGTENS